MVLVAVEGGVVGDSAAPWPGAGAESICALTVEDGEVLRLHRYANVPPIATRITKITRQAWPDRWGASLAFPFDRSIVETRWPGKELTNTPGCHIHCCRACGSIHDVRRLEVDLGHIGMIRLQGEEIRIPTREDGSRSHALGRLDLQDLAILLGVRNRGHLL